jgi:Mg-chelatase subunit ChlD
MIDYTKPWDCIVAILDASGSMDSIKNDAIGGFNSFLNEQKEQKGQASFSVVKFNGEVSFPRDLLQDINDSDGPI